MSRFISSALTALSVLTLATGQPAHSQDKSAASVIDLPQAGGTVSREEGTFGLNTNTGSANFQMPLPTLLDRGNWGPQDVALTYNQFAGDSGSGLGVGWGFSVPSVTVNDDLGTAVPGQRPGGGFFSQLTLSGARLVFLGAENGVWRYRPEFSEEHVEIAYHPGPFEVTSLGRTGERVAETIPSGFEVRHGDGSRMIFSGDPAVAEGQLDGPQPFVTRWPMVMRLNADGDAIRYEYARHGNRSYLSAITFAGGRSRYDFDLIETRPSLVSHAAGVRQQNAMLYGRVTARFDDTVYQQWCMGYIGRAMDDPSRFAVRAHPDCQAQAESDLTPLIDANSVNVLDQLRVLYRFGDTGGAPLGDTALRLPDIRFDYSSWTSAELAGRDLVYDAPNLGFAGDIPPQNFELADLNMDALVDVVRTTDDGATVLLGEGDLADAFRTSQPLMLSRTTEGGMLREIAPRLADDRFHFADIFGDSFVDIVEIEDGAVHVYDGKADGSFAYIGRRIALPGISPSLFTGGNARFQDVNMDGRSDIVTTRLDDDGATQWQIMLNLTRLQPDGSRPVSFGVTARPFPFPSQDGQILGRDNVRLQDMNGDRLPDLVTIRPAEQGLCVYENQGTPFAPAATLLFGEAGLADPVCGQGRFAAIDGMRPNDRLQTMWTVDVNGDGILDFASMGERTDQLRVWLGFGDGSFLPRPLDLALNLRVQVGTSAASFRSRVADMDGDGQSEIVVFQKPSGDEVKAVVVIDFNRAGGVQLAKANLLSVVDFASGRRHDVRYATSVDEMLRDRANGMPTRPLHFPVVLAKQMVTSEGAPGAARRDVTTEEYYYHNPFYDTINRRFIGFSDVEKVVWGDEFAGEETSQTSSVAYEQYYTFAEATADLHLAGKLRIRRTYELLPDAVMVASAEANVELDPSAPALHSLSTATRAQPLPRPGKMLACESQNWEAVDRDDGTSWIRKTSEAQSTAVGLDQTQQPGDEPVCAAALKTQTYADFDDFNLPATETTTLREIPGPDGLVVPGLTRVIQSDYAASRAALAPLGIVKAVSERRVLAGTRLMSREKMDYLPERGGRLGRREIEVFSGLDQVPDSLADHHQPIRSLIREMGYDIFGNTTSMSDPLGRIEAAEYDDTGVLLLAHTRFAGGDGALDQVTRNRYDGPRAGLVSSEVTPLGMEVAYEYDALARKVSERAADGAERRYAYRFGENGGPTLILTERRRYADAASTPEGESEWIRQLAAYSPRGQQVATLEDVTGGGVRVYEFARFNRNDKMVFRWTPFVARDFAGVADLDLRKVFDMGAIPVPEGRAVGESFRYDGAGRLLRSDTPAGKVTQVSYEPWGSARIITWPDTNGQTTSEELRLENENGVAAIVTGDGRGTRSATRFLRDSFGYLREIWLPGETEPRRLIFNSIGDPEYQSVPGMGEYYAFYDARGRQTLRARIAADGETHTLSTTYDGLNRKLTESEDGQLRVEFGYDRAVQIASAAPFAAPIQAPLGQPVQVTTHDPNGRFDAVQRFGYDANGRMVLNEMEIAGRRFAEGFRHTLDGRIAGATGPGGLSARYTLGADENLIAVTIEHPDFAQAERIIENIAYNPEGSIARIDYRGGAFTQMTYDPQTLYMTRIESIAAGRPLQDLSMTFNGNGSITVIDDALAGGDPAAGHVDRSGRFAYDFRNQLTEIQRYGQTAGFAYSDAGTFKRNGEFADADLARPADAQTGLIPAGSADKAYRFDGFGQLAASPKVTATVFDAYGRLLQARTAEGTVFFGYDQTGRRIYKQVVPDAGETTLYLFPTHDFEVGPQGGESFVRVGNARLVRMEHGTGRWFYYLRDHLESSDYLMTPDGVPVEQMLYRAYGTEHAPEVLAPAWADHLAAHAGETPREPTHHRFTGKYLDDATGLYYYGARYYDPDLGRFVSPDPLYLTDPERCTGNTIACSLFAYANNNPLSYVDPTGLDAVIAGTPAYRAEVERDLQRTDPTARVDSATGKLSQSWLHGAWLDVKNFFVPGTNFESGRELNRRVIDSAQTTTISFKAGATGADVVDRSIDPTKTPGDAVIHYDPAAALTRTSVEFDPKTGTVSREPADPGIVLGHEMIHASHIMAGQISGMNAVPYTGLNGVPQAPRMDEEVRTVGVGGTPRADDITENDLRRMLNINPRNNY
ncbi:RHS repeat-associated core domain-containing protein [Paracoccus sp. SSK6]|uniref:RHS repeat-associated core domain-containing protein n=1 Tax=Paracoccus sp. SSK6 TaxID=3143131 RepID=UPI00321BA93E